MCGISGAYATNNGGVAMVEVESMGRLMQHRGPDNFGCTAFERAAFAHNRLSFLDLSSSANQPFRNADFALVYNGEIYNFKVIRERLESEHGVHFLTTSDTEVLFYSLIHDGVDSCVRQIRGMFSFAFYDRKSHRLWLVRDRLGIKPLYYCLSKDTLYFGSETKALTKELGLRPNALRTLLAINGNIERSVEETLYDDVYSVKPGAYLEFDGERRSETIYYRPVDDADPELYRELGSMPGQAAVDEFERLLTNSISGMLVSDVPVGSFASGGVDSSLISAIASNYAPKINLFSADVVGRYSEFEDAKALSEAIGAPIFDYKFAPEQMLSDWSDCTYFYENPIIVHTNAIPFSRVARLAYKTGVKAVLTGEGADELFIGYPRLLTRRYDSLVKFPVTAIQALYRLVPGLKDYAFPEGGERPIDFASKVLSGFGGSLNKSDILDKIQFVPEKERSEYLLTLQMLSEHLVSLLRRNDRMGMMASIEARFPYLDENVVKFAINLPPKFKIGHTWRWHNYKHPFLVDKWPVRKLAGRHIPSHLSLKKKDGFPMYGHKNIQVRDGFFKNGWIEQCFSLGRSSQETMLKTQDRYFVAKLASIEIFGRIFGLGDDVGTVESHVLRHCEITLPEARTFATKDLPAATTSRI